MWFFLHESDETIAEDLVQTLYVIQLFQAALRVQMGIYFLLMCVDMWIGIDVEGFVK